MEQSLESKLSSHQSKTSEYVKEYNKTYYQRRGAEVKHCSVCKMDVKVFSFSKHSKSRYHNLALAFCLASAVGLANPLTPKTL